MTVRLQHIRDMCQVLMHAVGVAHSKLSLWPPLEYKYRAVRYKDKSGKGNTQGFPLLYDTREEGFRQN